MFTRRKFLQVAGISSATAAFPFLANCGPLTEPKAGLRASSSKLTDFRPDVDIELTAIYDTVPILSGSQTKVMRYQARLVAGDESRLVVLADNYLGPIIKMRKGENIRVRLVNDLSEETIIHWHGLRVPETADGHPRFAIAPGETYTYEFQVIDPAGTYWFHPHTHQRTGYQAYNGLAGMFIINDNNEDQLNLPSGEYDLPVIIQDRSFTSDNQLSYSTTNSMMGGMAGFFGERILINGTDSASFSLSATSHRFRLLNGSNARVYKIGWSDGSPLTVIGTDGGLLPAPLSKNYVMLAPGERIDLYADFSDRAIGSQFSLVNLSYDGDAFGGGMGNGNTGNGDMDGNGNNGNGNTGNGGMDGDGNNGGGMMGNVNRGGSLYSALEVGSQFTLLQISIDKAGSAPLPLPSVLIPMDRYAINSTVNAGSPRDFSLYMYAGSWTLNGRRFVMEEVAEDEKVRLGDMEIWQYTNRSGQPVPHPMHMHEARFQVYNRSHNGSWSASYATVSDGFIDSGWKDTVLVMPGEQVQVILKFDSYTGMFLNHCHNLEHHDNGMMRNFLIT